MKCLTNWEQLMQPSKLCPNFWISDVINSCENMISYGSWYVAAIWGEMSHWSSSKKIGSNKFFCIVAWVAINILVTDFHNRIESEGDRHSVTESLGLPIMMIFISSGLIGLSSLWEDLIFWPWEFPSSSLDACMIASIICTGIDSVPGFPTGSRLLVSPVTMVGTCSRVPVNAVATVGTCSALTLGTGLQLEWPWARHFPVSTEIFNLALGVSMTLPAGSKASHVCITARSLPINTWASIEVSLWICSHHPPLYFHSALGWVSIFKCMSVCLFVCLFVCLSVGNP